jgi:hypothetical protein
VAAIAANGEVGFEGAVLDHKSGHVGADRAHINRSTCSKASAASARSVATFYFETHDVDAIERQVSSSGNRFIVQGVDYGGGSHGKQSGVSCSRPLQRCPVSLNGDGCENERRRCQPERIVRVPIPGRVEGVHRLLQDDLERWGTALQHATGCVESVGIRQIERRVAGKFRCVDCLLQRATVGVGYSLLRGCDLNRCQRYGWLDGTQREQRDRCKRDPITNLSQKASYPAHMRAGQYVSLHVQFSR